MASQLTIKPLRDRIIIRPDQRAGERIQGGIWLFEQTDQPTLTTGRIVGYGDDVPEELQVMALRIIHSPYSGFSVTRDRQEYTIIGASEVIAIMEDETEAELS